MTEADIRRVEGALGVTIPSDLRAALLARGEDEFSPFAPDIFIEINLRRRWDTVLDDATGEPWPAHFLSIGGNGEDDGHVAYFVRCDLDPSGVWACDHLGRISRVADLDATTLDGWVE